VGVPAVSWVAGHICGAVLSAVVFGGRSDDHFLIRAPNTPKIICEASFCGATDVSHEPLIDACIISQFSRLVGAHQRTLLGSEGIVRPYAPG
jgi:hypothetical protein